MTLPQHADPGNSRASQKPKILIADDDKLIADSLQLLLTRAGLDAVAVYDGEPAVDVARQWRPDLFLCDVMMPFMNGLQAAIRITSLIPECHVILISGEELADDLMKEARKHGYHFELLQKPLQPAELLRQVRLRLTASSPEHLQAS
ncbi:MAG TPA: response regulator [Acidobacteriaceae bacterium]|nr:response regulator [Acidobacteriaceae bacterium]